MEILNIDKRENSVIIDYSGELTLEVTSQLKKEFESILENVEMKNFIFDMSKITFMDSSGIGFIVSMHNKIKQNNKFFLLFKPSLPIVKTFKLVKLLSFFEIIETDADLEYILSK